MDYVFESLMFDIECDMAFESFDAAMEAKDGKNVLESIKAIVVNFVKMVTDFISMHLPKGGKSKIEISEEDKNNAANAITAAVDEISADETNKIKVGPFKAIGSAMAKIKSGVFDNSTIAKLFAAMGKAVKDAWEENKNDKEAKTFAKLKKLFSAIIGAFRATTRAIKADKKDQKANSIEVKAYATDDLNKQNKMINKVNDLRNKANEIRNK